MFIALCVFMIMDYITGILKAVKTKKLSSRTGFLGIAKKVIILFIVCVANIIDIMLESNGIIRTFIMTFYICNEGISILENASVFNIPFPEKLKNILEGMRDENNEKGKKINKKN